MKTRVEELIVAIGLSILAVGCSQGTDAPEGRLEGASASFWAAVERASDAPSVEELARRQVAWSSVGALLSTTSQVSQSAIDRFLIAATSTAHAPANYMAGLILIGRGEPRLAAETFSGLDVGEIPLNQLYAPYRLSRALHPGETNRYGPLLTRALRENLLSPIVSARLNAEEGDFKAALIAYLKTDPSQWSRMDVSNFRAFTRSAGLQRDAWLMMAAALKAERPKAAIRGELESMLARDTSWIGDEARIQRALEQNEELRTAALRGYANHLEARRLFLERDYERLLADGSVHDPHLLSHEHLLLLTVASARTANDFQFRAWSTELRRRFPSADTARWLQSIEPRSMP